MEPKLVMSKSVTESYKQQMNDKRKPISFMVKVHLTPKCFFAKSNLLNIRSIWAKKVLNLLESSIFYALSKSHLKCCTTEF